MERNLSKQYHSSTQTVAEGSGCYTRISFRDRWYQTREIGRNRDNFEYQS